MGSPVTQAPKLLGFSSRFQYLFQADVLTLSIIQPSLSLTLQRPWLVLYLASAFALSSNTKRDADMWLHLLLAI